MGGIVFLWILLIIVGFVNHKFVLVGVVGGAGLLAILIYASASISSDPDKINKGPREREKWARDTYDSARVRMCRQLRFLELKYPLDLKEECLGSPDPVETLMRRVEEEWETGEPFHPYAFFQSSTSTDVLLMWMNNEDGVAFEETASQTYDKWKYWHREHADYEHHLKVVEDLRRG
ncbi:MAG: hypothetical protein ACYCYO_03825 [Bacilli bacterium]